MNTEARPALIVIFGVTGDLARRKLLPALYHLTRDNLLHPDTKVIGVTRQQLDKEDIIASLSKYTSSHTRPSPAALKSFSDAFQLIPVDLADVSAYKKLAKRLDGITKNRKNAFQRLYYLSVPPAVFDEVVGFMGKAGMHLPDASGMLPAIMIEKPFGYDLNSAKQLIKSAHEYFDEQQIYRIDHYLAKEMAQNILAFRYGNPLFESIWNRERIGKVVITAYERIGIEGRANFYEQTGALRDIIQSHLLQLMALVAMDIPKTISSQSVHQARAKFFKTILPPKPFEVKDVAFRGQYIGYGDEAGNPNSSVETYAALKLNVSSERWKGVPFILRTGKALNQKSTAIEVHFKGKKHNLLRFGLQPDEGISIGLQTKKPGHSFELIPTELEFSYARTYSGSINPDAYERVLLDCIKQDQTLFASSKEILTSWRITQPVLDEWAKSPDDLIRYKKGSEGPLSKTTWKKLLKI